MTRILVVGSGASGVHFAITALERGFEVALIDTGYQRPVAPEPTASFDGLKTTLPDPVEYFLGPTDEGVVYPATKPSYYGHPPSKAYVFKIPERFATRSVGMAPLFSFARGGLAEAWTAGSYEFNRDDLASFPISAAALTEGYREVARRIGITGQPDDLERFIPRDAEYLPPLPLDRHSALLMERYRARRDSINAKLGFFLGRSRVATLSQPHQGRPACDQLGRCLWGCPTDAIYSPAVTLRECFRFPAFSYHPGWLATHFEYDADHRVTGLAATSVDGGDQRGFTADRFVLTAGALASSKLVLDSIFRRTGTIERLPGLMDNRQIHLPFLLPAMIGQPLERAAYQFHHLAFGLEEPNPDEYIHGQITTLRAASVHPIVQSLPLDYLGALGVFRAVRPALGLANVNLHDRRRPGSFLTIKALDDGRTELVAEYQDDPAEAGQIERAVRRTGGALKRLGAIIPPGMTRVLPKGASVHYAGTLPMAGSATPLGATPEGRSWDWPNLYFGDGATFPFLPAKNLTFTLMANAVRIARAMAE